MVRKFTFFGIILLILDRSYTDYGQKVYFGGISVLVHIVTLFKRWEKIIRIRSRGELYELHRYAYKSRSVKNRCFKRSETILSCKMSKKMPENGKKIGPSQ